MACIGLLFTVSTSPPGASLGGDPSPISCLLSIPCQPSRVLSLNSQSFYRSWLPSSLVGSILAKL